MTKKSPHHQHDDEDRAERDAAARERNNDLPEDAERPCARVPRRLDQRLVDARHRVEDRHDHEQREEVDVAHHHREVGEEQPLHRVVDDADAHQRLVDQPLLPEQRDPRDHADDVRGPERHRAEQKETDRDQQRADVEHQEVGDGEADQQRDGPDDRGELQRAQIEPERVHGGEQVDIALRRERRPHTEDHVVLEEADRQQHAERYDEEDRQRNAERRHPHEGPPPRAGAVAHRVFGPNKAKGRAGPACDPALANETAQAVCSSDHFLSRNWWLSINVFQHAMLPKRLENEPPSRTCPAFSIRVP